MAALGMASAGATSAKEFHVAVLGPTGGAIRRVLTTAAEIGEWDPVVDELPSAVAGTSWAQDVESAGAAADLLESVRTATVRAVRAGAIERSRAATLMAEMRALLDEEERE